MLSDRNSRGWGPRSSDLAIKAASAAGKDGVDLGVVPGADTADAPGLGRLCAECGALPNAKPTRQGLPSVSEARDSGLT